MFCRNIRVLTGKVKRKRGKLGNRLWQLGVIRSDLKVEFCHLTTPDSESLTFNFGLQNHHLLESCPYLTATFLLRRLAAIKKGSQTGLKGGE